MKFTFQEKIDANDWPRPGEPFSAKFVQNFGAMVRQLSNGLGGGLTIGENLTAVWLTRSCTHNVGVQFYNPLPNKAAPKQIDVFPVLQPIRSHTWSYAPSTNLVSLTVSYDCAGTIAGPINRRRSAAAGLSTGVAKDVCATPSITLTTGDWEVRGAIGFSPGGATNEASLTAAISKSSATLPSSDVIAVPTTGESRVDETSVVAGGSGYEEVLLLPSYRTTISPGATLPLFLVAQASFSVSTLAVYGYLEARQVGPAPDLNDSPNILVIGG